VSGWYQFGGTVGTPTSGVACTVNPITKIWAHNAGVTINPASYGDAAAGFELDVYNSKGDSNDYTVLATGQTWGFDTYAAGPYKCSAGFVSRGYWKTGYVAHSAVTTATGFVTKGAEITGFSYESPVVGGTAFRSLYNGLVSFAINSSGSIELGRTDAAGVTLIDFHSSGVANDYDSRIIASGGAAGVGLGTLSYLGAQHTFTGPISSVTDTAITAKSINKSSYTSGTSYFYSFSLNGTIIGNINGNGSTTAYVTSSDYRLKDNVKPIVNALSKNDLLHPVSFKWKLNGEDGQGFIAHELQSVFPDAVCGNKDATKVVDGVEMPDYQGVDSSFLVGHLVACVQELTARIVELETRICLQG
jgi:hypothetical protein